MRILIAATASIVLALTAPAIAGTQYVRMSADGPFMRLIGSGGTMFSVDGVDFWTAGDPPRPYQILGAMLDKDDRKLMAMVGTPALARRVTNLGGNAVIVIDPAKLAAASRIDPTLITHQLQIVRYLPEGSSAVAPNDTAGQVQEMARWTREQCSAARGAKKPVLTHEDLVRLRSSIQQIGANRADAMKDAPEEVRSRNAKVQELLMEMLDCEDQALMEHATDEAIRGGVGTEVSWQSSTHPNVSGRSKVTGAEALADGGQCLTVTDVIIVEGEEAVVPKRMCRAKGATAYLKV